MELKIAVSITVGLATAVLVLAFVFGAGGSTTVTVAQDSVELPADGEAAVVHAKHQSGGIGVFGLTLKARDLWFSVGSVVDPACIDVDTDGADSVIATGECERYAPIAGPVVGGGVTSEGVSWVQVRVAISQGCFDASEPGDRWPSAHSTCQ